ncbi:protein angel homolog 1 isoform X2 [Takifugu flavidus]|nr:protein angel homolog 1 isoform X2 [Takifugu flavidus]
MEKRIKEPNSEKGENMEQVSKLQYSETNVEFGPEMTKVEEEELEIKNATCQERVEDPQQTDWEPKLGSQLGRLLLQDYIPKTILPVQEAITSPSLEESAAPSDHRLQQTTSTGEKQKDSFLVPGIAKNSQLSFGFASPNTATHPVGVECEQPYLHIPARPVITQVMQHPPLLFNHQYCHFPLSTFEAPLPVEWRVWQEVVTNVPTSEPDIQTFPSVSASLDFTVMSYNILADDLLQTNPDLYAHCPQEVLDWNYRCMRILLEIQKWAPDILCLQEVQENHFYEHLHPVLSLWGYNCVYKRRTGTKTDGCATCYHISCFSEVAVSSLEFYRPETKLLDRHNVAIVLLLRPVVGGSNAKALGPLLCVVNTHLLFNPRRGDVKLAQLAILLAEMDGVVQSHKARGVDCNLILCGDFNAVPYMPLYQLITTGRLYYQGLPAERISGQEAQSYGTSCHRLFAPLWPSSLGISASCQYTTVPKRLTNQNSLKTGKCCYSPDFLLQMRFSPAACVRPVDLMLIPGVTDIIPDPSKDIPANYNERHTLHHQLGLESVYSHFLPGSGNPEVTTLHSKGGATVDYIFYSPRRSFTTGQGGSPGFMREGLKLTGSLSLLSEEVLWSLNGLPNVTMPSDHLSLLAKFQMDLNIA